MYGIICHLIYFIKHLIKACRVDYHMTKSETFDVPILILAFNRPDTTKVVLERVLQINPTKLFVAVDGPRLNKVGEKELVEEVKDLFDSSGKIYKKRYLTENKGCKEAVSSAISWFFEEEPLGIILEDDCFPELSFFHFAGEMLQYYKNDPSIWVVSGHNYQGEWKLNEADYFFSKYSSIWGWATWKRVWDQIDFSFSYWPEHKAQNRLSQHLKTKEEVNYRTEVCDKAFNKEVSSWAYIFNYTRIINEGLTIFCSINQIKNIGFRL